MLAVQEGAAAVGDMVEHPLDTLAHLLEGEAVAVWGRHVQKVDASPSQRVGIVARLEPAVDHSRDATLSQALDLALPEGPTYGKPRRDVRVIQLLRL